VLTVILRANIASSFGKLDQSSQCPPGAAGIMLKTEAGVIRLSFGDDSTGVFAVFVLRKMNCDSVLPPEPLTCGIVNI